MSSAGDLEITNMAVPSKKMKLAPEIPTLRDTFRDIFCWECHKYSADVISCKACPRVFHLKCLKSKEAPSGDFICPECEPENKRSLPDKCYRKKLSQLLLFVLDRMRGHQKCQFFENLVDKKDYPDYKSYILKPICLSQLEKNIKNNYYNSCQAFVSDVRWLLHNCSIYFSGHSERISSARHLLKIAIQDCKEISNCADCYLRAQHSNDWFLEPCTLPHILVWAKCRGWPHWPGKVIQFIDNEVEVWFFQAHNKARVPAKNCLLYSRKGPKTPKKNVAFDKAIREAEQHIERLRNKFGEFSYSSPGIVLLPECADVQRKLLLPWFNENSETQTGTPVKRKESPSDINQPSTDLMSHKRKKVTPKRSVDSGASGSSSLCVLNQIKRPNSKLTSLLKNVSEEHKKSFMTTKDEPNKICNVLEDIESQSTKDSILKMLHQIRSDKETKAALKDEIYAGYVQTEDDNRQTEDVRANNLKPLLSEPDSFCVELPNAIFTASIVDIDNPITVSQNVSDLTQLRNSIIHLQNTYKACVKGPIQDAIHMLLKTVEACEHDEELGPNSHRKELTENFLYPTGQQVSSLVNNCVSEASSSNENTEVKNYPIKYLGNNSFKKEETSENVTECSEREKVAVATSEDVVLCNNDNSSASDQIKTDHQLMNTDNKNNVGAVEQIISHFQQSKYIQRIQESGEDKGSDSHESDIEEVGVDSDSNDEDSEVDGVLVISTDSEDSVSNNSLASTPSPTATGAEIINDHDQSHADISAISVLRQEDFSEPAPINDKEVGHTPCTKESPLENHLDGIDLRNNEFTEEDIKKLLIQSKEKRDNLKSLLPDILATIRQKSTTGDWKQVEETAEKFFKNVAACTLELRVLIQLRRNEVLKSDYKEIAAAALEDNQEEENLAQMNGKVYDPTLYQWRNFVTALKLGEHKSVTSEDFLIALKESDLEMTIGEGLTSSEMSSAEDSPPLEKPTSNSTKETTNPRLNERSSPCSTNSLDLGISRDRGARRSSKKKTSNQNLRKLVPQNGSFENTCVYTANIKSNDMLNGDLNVNYVADALSSARTNLVDRLRDEQLQSWISEMSNKELRNLCENGPLHTVNKPQNATIVLEPSDYTFNKEVVSNKARKSFPNSARKNLSNTARKSFPNSARRSVSSSPKCSGLSNSNSVENTNTSSGLDKDTTMRTSDRTDEK